MIKIETARRIIQLNDWIKSLRKDIAEIDAGRADVVTISVDYIGPKLQGSYYDSQFRRQMKLDGDDARRVANLIRHRKQQKLDDYLRELRRLDGEIVDG